MEHLDEHVAAHGIEPVARSATLTQMHARLGRIEARLLAIETRLSSVERHLRHMRTTTLAVGGVLGVLMTVYKFL